MKLRKPCFTARRQCSISLGERSEEHTSELQSHSDLVCRLLLEKKNDGKLGLGEEPGLQGRAARRCLSAHQRLFAVISRTWSGTYDPTPQWLNQPIDVTVACCVR